MKKLKLNLQQLEDVEVLTRSQLKSVLGGVVATTTSDCIPDGQACGWFKLCCHSCNASFDCAASQ